METAAAATKETPLANSSNSFMVKRQIKQCVDIEAAGLPHQSHEQVTKVSTCTLCWASEPQNLSGQGISVTPVKHREDRGVNSDSSGLSVSCTTRSHASSWCHLYLYPNVGFNRHLSFIPEDR